jgi:OOP family OmpA-OmpF porin
MLMQLVRLSACIFALALAGLASAADAGWYAGASIGNVTHDAEDLDVGVVLHHEGIDEDPGFKIVGGYRLFRWLAVEANYLDFGTAEGNLGIVCIPEEPGCGSALPFHYDSSAFSLSALLSLSAGPVEFFARGGMARWEAEFSQRNAQLPTWRSENDGIDPTFGFGMQFHVRSFAIRAEYERLELGASTSKLLSAGLTYYFR